MKNKFLFLISLLLLGTFAFCRSSNLPAPDKEDFLFFTADEVNYDSTDGTAELKGNVRINLNKNGEQYTILGEEFTVHPKDEKISSSSPVTIQNNQGTFTLQKFEYNSKDKEIIMNNFHAQYGPMRIISAEQFSGQETEYNLKKAVLTCCDKESPHYTMTIGSAKLKPEVSISGTNAVARLGKIPVLYLPYFYRSLNKDHLFTTYLDFGQSKNTGLGILTSTVYSKGNFAATGNLDYYTKAGIGYGLIVGYDDPLKFRGNIQAYTIKDKVMDTQRWGVNGGFWWEMYDNSNSLNDEDGAIYFAQMKTRTVSDPDFNNDFFRNNPYVVSPDKLTQTSLVRQSRVSNFRVSYYDISQLDEATKTFHNYKTDLPEISWTFTPFVLPKTGGIVNNFNLSFNNTKFNERPEDNNDFLQYFKATWKSSKSFRLHRNLTLTPSVFYNQEVAFKDPVSHEKDNYVGRYGTEVNLRTNLPTGALDFGYRYKHRTTDKVLVIDEYQNVFNREEQNAFYIQNYYMPTNNLYFKIASGISINNDNSSWKLNDRLEPLLAEIGYFNQQTGTNFFLQNLYDFEGGNQAFVINTTFHDPRDPENKYITLGVTNYKTTRHSFLFTTKFAIAPKESTWHANMGIDFEIKDTSVRSYSKHILVYKDFHDFNVMLGVRDRSHNLSFHFAVNVLCGGKGKDTPAQQRINQYWYPWQDSYTAAGPNL
ncbi:MAG: LPS-assembly protein LptD [Elusimicrobiaceae bacterium]|nr:LPS-assembly protein LptD [Elusimicrobiaceae bacterium]